MKLRATMMVLWLAACRPTAPPPVPPATALGPAFLARQTVVARHGAETSRFDAVLQYDGETLLLLGLTPMGTKAFAVHQRGDTIRTETFVDIPLPAPAEAVLLDIHRAWFDDRPTTIRADGWHRRRVPQPAGCSLRVHERWAAGRLHERIWGARHRPDARMRWPGGIVGDAVPMRVLVDHPELALQLEIHTLDRRPLATAPH